MHQIGLFEEVEALKFHRENRMFYGALSRSVIWLKCTVKRGDFADASRRKFRAAAVYAHALTSTDEPRTTLLAGTFKVSPLMQICNESRRTLFSLLSLITVSVYSYPSRFQAQKYFNIHIQFSKDCLEGGGWLRIFYMEKILNVTNSKKKKKTEIKRSIYSFTSSSCGRFFSESFSIRRNRWYLVEFFRLLSHYVHIVTFRYCRMKIKK